MADPTGPTAGLDRLAPLHPAPPHPATAEALQLAPLAVVAIGRNEGARAVACVTSALASGAPVVYVDSGSKDGSPAVVQDLGAAVVALDLTRPFTAARARNAGFDEARSMVAGLMFVQFVDGDCEFEAGWLAAAQAYLAANPKVAAVFGQRKERYPDRSVYNLMCDLSWNAAPGVTRHCGGDVMMRCAALAAVGGYRDDLIAGEEPELCVRLRAAGWQIVSLDVPMTKHDAAILRYGQWWQRTVRTGYAFAQGAAIHGGAPEYHWVRETARAVLWGLALPVVSLACALLWGPVGLLPLALYPLQLARLYRANTDNQPQPMLRAFMLLSGKFAEAWGALKFARDWLFQRRSGLIEYK